MIEQWPVSESLVSASLIDQQTWSLESDIAEFDGGDDDDSLNSVVMCGAADGDDGGASESGAEEMAIT